MTQKTEQSNYSKYRGKCKEMCKALQKENPTFRLVRGHYFCPIWNTENQHWWCVTPDKTIIDPTAMQFPSEGHGIYTEFDGIVTCEECGKQLPEEEAIFMGAYPTCSGSCARRLVGV